MEYYDITSDENMHATRYAYFSILGPINIGFEKADIKYQTLKKDIKDSYQSYLYDFAESFHMEKVNGYYVFIIRSWLPNQKAHKYPLLYKAILHEIKEFEK